MFERHYGLYIELGLRVMAKAARGQAGSAKTRTIRTGDYNSAMHCVAKKLCAIGKLKGRGGTGG